MNIKNTIEMLEYTAKAQVTPFLWGHAGIGKSSIVKQWAVKNGYKFFPFYLGTQSDLGDILGLADFVRDAEGNPVSTTFAIPKWLKDTVDYCNANPDSGAVIFLDEFNRARRDILNGMFSLALDKTFHTLVLPKNCYIIAAGNPPTDEYFTTDVDETALMARFVHIKLEPTVDEWVKYATEAKMDDSIVQFIRQQPELLETKRSVFQLPIKLDRRAWSRLDAIKKTGLPEHLIQEVMMGTVGLEATVAYQQFQKTQDKPLTAAEIINGSGVALLKKWSDPTNTTASLLNLSVDNLMAYIQALQPTDILPDDVKANIMQFLLIVPKDLTYKSVKDLVSVENLPFKDLYMSNPKYLADLEAIIKSVQVTTAA